MVIRIQGQRKLATPPGNQTRPTTAKVRQALFNIWQNSVSGCRWLDLCAGSGAMGAEALVRGASVVVGIEKNPQACRLIQHNWQSLAQTEQQFQVIRADVLQALKQLPPAPFDHIYFDPPYDSHLYQPVLKLIAELNLLSPTGAMAVECRTHQLPDLTGLGAYRQKVYGSTTLIIASSFNDEIMT
ncbi:16S rRNA (guanine(966)-N(2))-methyltransferase RsmD [Thermosynechococcaceae cyanobacterium BACA0444]|uniref:16S rRNA (Guanine(966)-N(2))-methyltransferase RsmD n=1 Tax=Pseudocalidococcus azoricus BACA0444 TaxID=2918990 RepID=A0AAE4JYT0_9CYAN|nr:16S rRNA (guanine(966)-N(2))-methyltransferase RsmD [Pseudocalidococcus azoricus]MDS3862498.1 16S rRNA (guanine(966)-N(2))-methyltransferase RsmD [Pseudocalidococcus azoricus BACA0444]